MFQFDCSWCTWVPYSHKPNITAIAYFAYTCTLKLGWGGGGGGGAEAEVSGIREINDKLKIWNVLTQ